MRVNIFSGGRRIAIVTGVLCAALAGTFVWSLKEPRYSLTYRLAGAAAGPWTKYQERANPFGDLIPQPETPPAASALKPATDPELLRQPNDGQTHDDWIDVPNASAETDPWAAFPPAALVQPVKSCSYPSEIWKSGYVPTDSAAGVYLSLCLPKWMEASADLVFSRFQIPEADKARASAALSMQVRRRYEVLGYTILGVAAAVWLLTAVIGWIVRGFLGVPRGADFRSTNEGR